LPEDTPKAKASVTLID